MILPLRRVAAAAFAALLIVFAFQARPASADVRCGHVKCAIQIKAERPSSVRMTWEQWFSPAEPLTKVEVFDRRTLALIEPLRTSDFREFHIHGVHDLCVELQVRAVRVAGAGARVSITALVYNNGPGSAPADRRAGPAPRDARLRRHGGRVGDPQRELEQPDLRGGDRSAALQHLRPLLRLMRHLVVAAIAALSLLSLPAAASAAEPQPTTGAYMWHQAGYMWNQGSYMWHEAGYMWHPATKIIAPGA